MARICGCHLVYGAILAGGDHRIYVSNGARRFVYVLYYGECNESENAATVGTINSLGIKPNTDECHTMAIIACGASIITTVVIVALGVVIAAPLAPVLESPVIQPAFDYVVPALFGGLVAQTILKGKKQFLFFLAPLAICLFFCYLRL